MGVVPALSYSECYYEQEWETISYGTTNDKTINKKNIINNL